MQWYVIHTLTGKENKVKAVIEKSVAAQDLEYLVGRILIPTETEIGSAGGKRRERKRKLYPGYVLMEMNLTDELRHLIQRTAGVTHFVGSSNSPVPLSEEEVSGIMRTIGEEGQRAKVVWSVGDVVRVTEGPFGEFTGSIAELDIEHETVKILISIFGRETPVELGFTEIEKL